MCRPEGRLPSFRCVLYVYVGCRLAAAMHCEHAAACNTYDLSSGEDVRRCAVQSVAYGFMWEILCWNIRREGKVGEAGLVRRGLPNNLSSRS